MKKWHLVFENNVYKIVNDNGVIFTYNPTSGIQILEDEQGYAYLDLNGNGRIDRFEDWHLNEKERYNDLCLNLV